MAFPACKGKGENPLLSFGLLWGQDTSQDDKKAPTSFWSMGASAFPTCLRKGDLQPFPLNFIFLQIPSPTMPEASRSMVPGSGVAVGLRVPGTLSLLFPGFIPLN